MASEVVICNLALAHLGDRATVASIDPPEGSVQAEHCKRFYPLARDELLESYEWAFATKTVQLAELATAVYGWDYSYGQPADLLKPIEILVSSTLGSTSSSHNGFCDNLFDWQPQPVAFTREVDSDGRFTIMTNQPDAVLKYIARITDTTRFSALFTTALSWNLAAKLAGPVIKGDAGAAMEVQCTKVYMRIMSEAMTADARSRRVTPRHIPAHIAARG